MANINWDWLLGFIEGEGSFIIGTGLKSKKHAKSGYQIAPFFSIMQIHDDDSKNTELMKNIQTFLASNNIKSNTYVSKYVRNGNLWYRDKLVVWSFADDLKLGNILKNLNWITRRKAVFDIWLEAVEIVNRKEHLTQKGLDRIFALKRQLNEIYKYRTRTKNFDFRVNKERYEKILKLSNQNKTDLEISKDLKLNIATVRRYLEYGEKLLNGGNVE